MSAEPWLEQVARQWAGAAEDLALLFAGQPDAAVEAELAEVRANLRADFVTRYPGALDWDALLDGFVRVVRERRAAIEIQTPRMGDGPH